MLETSIAHTEIRSRRIEAFLVISLTALVFVFFGFLQENQSAIRRPPLSRMIGFPIIYAIIPTLITAGTYGVASYLKSRFLTWTGLRIVRRSSLVLLLPIHWKHILVFHSNCFLNSAKSCLNCSNSERSNPTSFSSFSIRSLEPEAPERGVVDSIAIVV